MTSLAYTPVVGKSVYIKNIKGEFSRATVDGFVYKHGKVGVKVSIDGMFTRIYTKRVNDEWILKGKATNPASRHKLHFA